MHSATILSSSAHFLILLCLFLCYIYRSLGCILVEMHTGKPLFDGMDEGDQMMKQVEVLGLPPKIMLEKNRKAEKFFEPNEEDNNEFRLKKKYTPQRNISLRKALSSKWQDNELYIAFEDLILKMLNYNPMERIRPSAALAHPFFQLISQAIAAQQAQEAAAGASSSSTDPASAQAMDTSSPKNANTTTQSGTTQAAAANTSTNASGADNNGNNTMSDADGSSVNPRKRPHSNPCLTSAPFTPGAPGVTGTAEKEGVEQPTPKSGQGAGETGTQQGKEKDVLDDKSITSTDTSTSSSPGAQAALAQAQAQENTSKALQRMSLGADDQNERRDPDGSVSSRTRSHTQNNQQQ